MSKDYTAQKQARQRSDLAREVARHASLQNIYPTEPVTAELTLDQSDSQTELTESNLNALSLGVVDLKEMKNREFKNKRQMLKLDRRVSIWDQQILDQDAQFNEGER